MLNTVIKKIRFKLSFNRNKPILYLFAGQGTQQKGMLNQLLLIPQAKQEITKFGNLLEIDFVEINSTDKFNLINKTKITQPLIVLSQVLRFKYLNKCALNQEDYMIGHSIGEYSALCIAKSIGLQECLKLVSLRGDLMQKYTSDPSGMLIVRFSDQNKKKVQQIIKENNLEIACFNTPNNLNLAGSLLNLQKTRAKFKQNMITCLFLPVSAAFHSKILINMVQPFREYISNIKFLKPMAKIIRNLDAQFYIEDSDIKQGLIKHLTNPVQLQQSIRKVNKQIQWVEIGHMNLVRKYVQQTRKKMK